mmetsp:Transcript_7280/g.18155  ORF Transcript_7280/g.18155 Transcript_7280/m.18155 type:complete len:348 (-) Transcript_7280:397-1440(-)
MAHNYNGDLTVASVAALGNAMTPPPPTPAAGPVSRRKSATGSLASTRANSPCGSSSVASSSEDAAGRGLVMGSASPSKRRGSSSALASDEVQPGALALRRGVRSAILSDLGIERSVQSSEALACSPSSFPASPGPMMLATVAASPTAIDRQCASSCPAGSACLAQLVNSTRVTSYHQASPIGGDASQRSLGCAVVGTPVTSCSRMPQGGLLGAGFSCATAGNGDASHRRPLTLTATMAPSTSTTHSPHGDASQRIPSHRRPASVPAVAAAAASGSESLQSPICAAFPCSSPPGDASQRSSIIASPTTTFIGSGALTCWLAGDSRAVLMSSEELADKLISAAPEMYED